MSGFISHKQPVVILLRMLIAITLLVLSPACGQVATPAALSPVPSLQTIRLGYTPALLPWAEAAGRCAANLPDVAFFPIEIAENSNIALELQLAYFVEESDKPQEFTYKISQESLVLIKNHVNMLPALDQEMVGGVLSGRIVDWREVSGAALPITTTVTQTIVLIGYPVGDPLQISLANSTGTQPPPQVRLVPDPAAMLQAVHEDPAALGYVPESWLGSNRPAEVQQIDSARINLSVVAFTLSPPVGAVKALLVCLQNP
jgi:hypothetical protein